MTIGLLIALIVVLALFIINMKRAKKETTYELTPNRLLTRYPLVFLTGHRTLFYFLSYWNELPAFLTAHGYHVYVMPLPWKPKQAKKFLQHYFHRRADKDKKFHFIIDSSMHSMMEELLLTEAHPQIASVTCAGHLQTEDASDKRNTKSFKALPIPIEDLDLLRFEDLKNPWWWNLHLLITGQTSSFSITHVGWPFVRPAYEIFLDRAAVLAERDLIQGS